LTGRKYALIYDYALNSYMRLIASLYGMPKGMSFAQILPYGSVL